MYITVFVYICIYYNIYNNHPEVDRVWDFRAYWHFDEGFLRFPDFIFSIPSYFSIIKNVCGCIVTTCVRTIPVLFHLTRQVCLPQRGKCV